MVLGLARHLVGAAPVAEDGPADEQEGEAADDDAGDEEALPEVEGRAGLGGGALVGAEGRELAAGEEQGARGPTATTASRRRGLLALRPGVSGGSEDGLVSDESTRADTIEPGKKIGNGSPVGVPPERRQCGCGGAADSLAAQVKTPRAMVEVARAARAAKTCWRARCTAWSSGAASQACSARWPARRSAPSAAGSDRATSSPRPAARRPVGQGAGPAGQLGQLGRQGALGRPASAWPGCRPTSRRTGARPCAR